MRGAVHLIGILVATFRLLKTNDGVASGLRAQPLRSFDRCIVFIDVVFFGGFESGLLQALVSFLRLLIHFPPSSRSSIPCL